MVTLTADLIQSLCGVASRYLIITWTFGENVGITLCTGKNAISLNLLVKQKNSRRNSYEHLAVGCGRPEGETVGSPFVVIWLQIKVIIVDIRVEDYQRTQGTTPLRQLGLNRLNSPPASPSRNEEDDGAYSA